MFFRISISGCIICFGLFLCCSSCLKDKTTKPITFTCDETISYSAEIVPEIINQSCNMAGCHNAGTSAGGYSFTGHDEVSSNAEIIFKALFHDETVVPMPLGGARLEDSLIQKFYCWIEQGKLDN